MTSRGKGVTFMNMTVRKKGGCADVEAGTVGAATIHCTQLSIGGKQPATHFTTLAPTK